MCVCGSSWCGVTLNTHFVVYNYRLYSELVFVKGWAYSFWPCYEIFWLKLFWYFISVFRWPNDLCTAVGEFAKSLCFSLILSAKCPVKLNQVDCFLLQHLNQAERCPGQHWHSCVRDFLHIFCLKDSTWAPYEQTKTVSRTFSFLLWYLIPKFEKFRLHADNHVTLRGDQFSELKIWIYIRENDFEAKPC